jgi:hypothetical protein
MMNSQEVKNQKKCHAEPCAELISVLIQHLTKSRTYETLKQPMKQVQGMVQGDRLGLFSRPSKIEESNLQGSEEKR